MKTYATQYATLTVDYDKPVDGYPNNNIDRSKEQEGTEAAISACTNEEFLAEYLKLAPDDIIIG